MNEISDEDSSFSPDGGSEILLAYKNQFIKFAVFIAFLIVLFALTALFSALANSSFRKGLKENLVYALEEKAYEDVKVGDCIELKNPFAVSAICFSVSGCEYSHAVIIRLTTVIGPVPAVYFYDISSHDADFLCFLSLEKRTEQFLLDGTKFSLTQYWEKRLPSILSNLEEEY